MKTKIIILTILLLRIHSISYAQTTWAPVGAVQHYEFRSGWGQYVSYVTIESTKDTIIQGIECRKLEQKGPGTQPDHWTSETFFTYESNDTVYLFDGTSFRVLYNFGAETNESWEAYGPISKLSVCDDSLTTVLVDSTGFQTINGQELKYLRVNTPEESWGFSFCNSLDETHDILQKIGSLEYLVPQKVCGIDLPTICYLRCYEDSEIGFYSTGIANTCDYETGVGITEVGFDDQVKVYPNPMMSDLNIELTDINRLGEYTLQIRNVQGSVVKLVKLNRNKENINIEDLNHGVYIVMITVDNTTTKRKIVKL